jgi:hypothetical protein
MKMRRMTKPGLKGWKKNVRLVDGLDMTGMSLVANFHSVEAISPFSIIPLKSKQKG